MTQLDEAVHTDGAASETPEELSYRQRRQDQAKELYRSTEALREQVLRMRSLVIVLVAVVAVALVVIGLSGSDED